ncbi:hypothetical protein BESB_073270 [Besnoitia besnoiti]|uniref:TRAPP trafficking subunit Trs65 n=1 Tax=Besnoitia besnoiti TaxID=94643 RepID=A0A2A9M855_BESBE|nr:uncharacterized protein BESB_073270 [Besnoitia besnoiti]PFH34175.1 hypothetical protein BESB_073270 [Besnoitia besnoiti]
MSANISKCLVNSPAPVHVTTAQQPSNVSSLSQKSCDVFTVLASQRAADSGGGVLSCVDAAARRARGVGPERAPCQPPRSSPRPTLKGSETGAAGGQRDVEPERHRAGAVGAGAGPAAASAAAATPGDLQKDSGAAPESADREPGLGKGSGFEDADVYVIYLPDLLAARLIRRRRKLYSPHSPCYGGARSASPLSRRCDADAHCEPGCRGEFRRASGEPGVRPEGSEGRWLLEGCKADGFAEEDDADEVLAACKYLIGTGRLKEVPEWRPQEVLQGQLLHLAAVVLPTDAVVRAGPVALEEWIRKFSSLSATVDLVSADAKGSSGKAAKNKPSALSCQFWEAQAFPIDTQESVSVEIVPFTYEEPADVDAAPGKPLEAGRPAAQRRGSPSRVHAKGACHLSPSAFATSAHARDRDGGEQRQRQREETDPASTGGDASSLSRIDTALLGRADISEDVLRQVGAERLCFIVDIRIPMTVNPQYLGKPLSLELSFSVVPVDPSPLSLIDSMRESIQVPFSAWAAAHGLTAASTVALQSELAAPTLDLLSLPFSSAFTGARFACSGRTQEGTESWWAPPVGADEKPSRDDGLGDRVGRSMEMLVHSLASLAAGDPTSRTKLQRTAVEHRVLCPLSVHRPLQVTTALMDSFMYVQIENSTDDVPLTIENVILRSVNSHAQGELPVTLHAGEQYSVLLRLDDSFLSHQTPKWDPARDSHDGGAGRSQRTSGPGAGRRDSRYGQSGKTVLPLCLKWRIEDSSGPAVWSQFGAECQLSTRTPLHVTLSCFAEPPGLQNLVTAVLSVVNNENFDVDLLALLPRDVQYQQQTQRMYSHAAPNAVPSGDREAQTAADEPPALIPLSSKKELGRIAPGGSQSVYLQFLATRSGLHPLPPILLLDRRNNRKILARGGQVVVAQ